MKKDRVTLEMLTDEDFTKYEIAAELGLLKKVKEGGWKNLTSKESGKIGGLIAARKKIKEKDKIEKNS